MDRDVEHRDTKANHPKPKQDGLRRGIVILCWFWIAFWSINKLARLVTSGLGANDLDFTNPSPATLIMIPAVIVLIVLRSGANTGERKRENDNTRS